MEAKVNGNDNQTTMVIEAMEKREVAVFDVTSAFMQVNMDELVQMRFTGKMEELLLEIDKDMYKSCITRERGEKLCMWNF